MKIVHKRRQLWKKRQFNATVTLIFPNMGDETSVYTMNHPKEMCNCIHWFVLLMLGNVSSYDQARLTHGS